MSRRALPFLRRCLRFRLRTPLLAVLVISVAWGIYVNRVLRQQEWNINNGAAAPPYTGDDSWKDRNR